MADENLQLRPHGAPPARRCANGQLRIAVNLRAQHAPRVYGGRRGVVVHAGKRQHVNHRILPALRKHVGEINLRKPASGKDLTGRVGRVVPFGGVRNERGVLPVPAAVFVGRDAVSHARCNRGGVVERDGRAFWIQRCALENDARQFAQRLIDRGAGVVADEREIVLLRIGLRAGAGLPCAQIGVHFAQGDGAVAVLVGGVGAVKPRARDERGGEVARAGRRFFRVGLPVPRKLVCAGGDEHMEIIAAEGRANARRADRRRNALADQRAGGAGVHEQHLLPRNARQQRFQRLRADFFLHGAVGEKQRALRQRAARIERAVRADVDEGNIVLVRAGKRPVDGGLERIRAGCNAVQAADEKAARIQLQHGFHHLYIVMGDGGGF